MVLLFTVEPSKSRGWPRHCQHCVHAVRWSVRLDQTLTRNTVGRGILLDYVAYARANKIKYNTFSTHQIPLSALEAMIQEHDITVEHGDILFIRTGVMGDWTCMTDEQRRAYATSSRPEHAGVEATVELLEWIWDGGFSAVAGDAISWEVYPKQGDVSVHEYLLAGWGCPIGELFDLDELSRTCEELGRWTFFVTSMPLNMPGGVSSPPNAMAIF